MKYYKTTFHKVIIAIFIFLSGLNWVNSCFIKYNIIHLSENQILYIYSSLAQVIGALLGLTIAGYSVIDTKIQSLGTTDDTITDYTDKLRYDYFHALMFIIAFSVIDIIFCLITLAIYKSDIFIWYLPFFMTESILLFLLIMEEVIRFALYLNPSSLKIKGSQEKQIIDNEYQTTGESQDNFSAFITYYNLLEQLLKKYACELIQNTQSAYKLQFFEVLDILLENKIINKDIYNSINELRKYRNALVHSLESDKTVNPKIYEKLQKIYNLIKDIYENRNDEKVKDQKINTLFHYSEECRTSELEQKLFSYLKDFPSASISEIAERLGYSKASIVYKLNLLQRSGLIRNNHLGKTNNWEVVEDDRK